MSKHTFLGYMLSLAFYALLIDMSVHLGGWRMFEPIALIIVTIVLMSKIRAFFSEDGPADLPTPQRKAPPMPKCKSAKGSDKSE